MEKIKNLKGAIVAIVTPFNEDKTIDFSSLEKLIEFHLQNKTDGIVVCGTTGEAVTLTTAEYEQIIGFVCAKVNKKIPVIAGSGGNDTAKVIELSKIAKNQGVDALLIVTPYYNKPNETGMFAHYQTVAANVDCPIIMYNVPGRTGVNMPPAMVKKLAENCKNIVGIKEAAGNVEQMMDLISCLPSDFLIFSGDDSLAMAAICMGAKGCISVAANVIPLQFRHLIHSALENNLEEARRIQYKYLNFMRMNFIESNPVPVKTALHLLGFVKEEFRLPLGVLSEKNKNLLAAELKTLNLL